jgi:hypothetical protein
MVTTTLVGHTSMEQLEQSLKYMTMEKQLDDGIMWEIDMVRWISTTFFCRVVRLMSHQLMSHQFLLDCFNKQVHMRNRLPIFSSDRVGRDWDGRGEIGETIP